MALEGELRDFNILEVIQLLGQQGKTGVLKVLGSTKKDDESAIFFFEGRVTHATSTRRTAGGLLGERLAKTGVISRDNLYSALRSQKKSDRFFGEIVVEEGMAEKSAVINAIYTQIHELVYELFRLQEGKFKFDPLAESAFPKISVKLHADELMLNILKMVDEWPELEKKVPPLAMVLQKAGALEKHGISLSEEHNAIYRLVDGTRSVQEIIDMSLLGKFATLEIVASLLEDGDIKQVGVKKEDAPVYTAPPLTVMWKGKRAHIGYSLGLIMSLILLFISFFPFSLDFLLKDRQGGGSAFQGYNEKMRQERVEWGKKIFFLERGRYPENRKELIDAGILTEKDVKEIDVRRKSNHP